MPVGRTIRMSKSTVRIEPILGFGLHQAVWFQRNDRLDRRLAARVWSSLVWVQSESPVRFCEVASLLHNRSLPSYGLR